MENAYDSLPDVDKKMFCENMLQKKGFFEDAYKMMMDSFQIAVKTQSDDVGSGVVNEKVIEKVEK